MHYSTKGEADYHLARCDYIAGGARSTTFEINGSMVLNGTFIFCAEHSQVYAKKIYSVLLIRYAEIHFSFECYK
jgi:hypothetical protein